IVLLPFDGGALTDVATKAMDAGIPVINVDREFSSPFASRTTVLGDNYGMGVSAGTYICEQLGDQPDAVVAEIAGIDSLPLTQDRSQGFADALDGCGLEVANRVAADFTAQG
ncbi:substrate-binding domain-containing protein, partial [Bacillus licheniformis]